MPMPGSIGGWRPVGPGGPGADGRWPRCGCSAVDGRAETARVALDRVGKWEGGEDTKDEHTFPQYFFLCITRKEVTRKQTLTEDYCGFPGFPAPQFGRPRHYLFTTPMTPAQLSRKVNQST